MMHFFQKRCEECKKLYAVRRLKGAMMIVALANVDCPHCFPEKLINVCASCRLPFSIVPHHSGELCFSCFQNRRRYISRRNATLPPWTNNSPEET